MKGWTVLPLALMVLMSIPLLPSVSADQEYDGDLGCMYSMEVMFIFNGENADRVVWDFGDGSEPVEALDVQHRFPAEGTYYVTQTAINGDGPDRRESVAVYRVEIMGYPKISFDPHGGSPVDTIHQDRFKVPATEPVAPVRDGYTFAGWFLDEELSEAMDWSMPIRTDMTLHAGWTPVMTPGGPSSGDPMGPAPDDGPGNTGDDGHVHGGTDTMLLAGVLALTLASVVVFTFLISRRH